MFSEDENASNSPSNIGGVPSAMPAAKKAVNIAVTCAVVLAKK